MRCFDDRKATGAAAREFRKSAVADFCRTSNCQLRCAFVQSATGSVQPFGGGATTFIPRNHAIYEEGAPAHHCFRVAHGTVRISHELRNGSRQVVDLLFSGDAFGFDPGDNYVGTAEAATDVQVLRCRRDCLTQLCMQEGFASALAAMLGRRLEAAQDHVVLLGHQSARARVATFLLRLNARQKSKLGQAIDLPVPRQDMADYLGLTLETTCRALSDLKQSGIVSTPCRREILIHDLHRLTVISGGGYV